MWAQGRVPGVDQFWPGELVPGANSGIYDTSWAGCLNSYRLRGTPYRRAAFGTKARTFGNLASALVTEHSVDLQYWWFMDCADLVLTARLMREASDHKPSNTLNARDYDYRNLYI